MRLPRGDPLGEVDVGGPAPTAAGRPRRADLSMVAALLPLLALLPISLVTLVPFWLPFSGRLSFPTFILAYLMLGACLLSRSVQRLLLRRLFGLRPPTPAERAVLEPAWRSVLARAGVPEDRYLLAVEDGPRLNAVAAGGHVVATTTTALRSLPHDEIEAILAHELGHHLGLHSVVPVVSYWLGAPIVALARAASWLDRVALWFARISGIVGLWPVALGALIVSWTVRAVARTLLLLVRQAGAMGNIAGRRSEYIADRAAVDLGYADQLSRALERLVEAEGGRSRQTVGDRLFATHPPLRKRLRRIQAALAQRSGPHPA